MDRNEDAPNRQNDARTGSQGGTKLTQANPVSFSAPTLAQLIAEHRARNNIKSSSDRRRTPLIRRMQSRSIARATKRR